MLEGFAAGIPVALQPVALLWTLFGVVWGILAGALPGITGSIGMALLLPLTFGMDSKIALMMLASVYIGSMYGGSISAILLKAPGTPGAAATVIDGYELHRRGESGRALGISLMASTTGGLIGVCVLVGLAVPLSKLALAFGPPEYFALGVFGIVLISSFAGKDLIKGAISGVGGLILATVGTDPFSGTARFTLDSPSLLAGIGLIPGMIGLLAVSEIFEQIAVSRTRERIKSAFSTALPKLKEFWKARVAMSIGAVIGALEGMLPGAGGAIAAFISYDQAKRWSKTPEEFGHGSVEGIAAPECANNVVTGTALVPLLTFGIPGSNSSAILLAAMMMHGIQPGPQIFEGTPDLVYGLFTAMFIANIMMFCVGLLALRPAITLVNIEPPLLLSGILGVIVVGAFALNNQMFEVWIVLGMGLLGFFMNRYGFNVLAMVLGLVLGFMVEANMRRSLLISLGDPWVFVTRPMSATLLALALITLITPLVRGARADRLERRKPVTQDRP